MDSQTVQQLRAVAREYGLKGYSRLNSRRIFSNL